MLGTPLGPVDIRFGHGNRHSPLFVGSAPTPFPDRSRLNFSRPYCYFMVLWGQLAFGPPTGTPSGFSRGVVPAPPARVRAGSVFAGRHSVMPGRRPRATCGCARAGAPAHWGGFSAACVVLVAGAGCHAGSEHVVFCPVGWGADGVLGPLVCRVMRVLWTGPCLSVVQWVRRGFAPSLGVLILLAVPRFGAGARPLCAT